MSCYVCISSYRLADPARWLRNTACELSRNMTNECVSYDDKVSILSDSICTTCYDDEVSLVFDNKYTTYKAKRYTKIIIDDNKDNHMSSIHVMFTCLVKFLYNSQVRQLTYYVYIPKNLCYGISFVHSVVCTILRRKYVVISTDARWCKSDNDENVNYSYRFGRYLSITFIFSVVVINNAVYTAIAALGRLSTSQTYALCTPIPRRLTTLMATTTTFHAQAQKPNCSRMEDVRRRKSVY